MAKKGQKQGKADIVQRAVNLTQGGESLLEQGIKAAKKNSAKLTQLPKW